MRHRIPGTGCPQRGNAYAPSARWRRNAAGCLAADGHTIIVNHVGLAINESLYSKLAFSPRKDFAPVTLFATVPNVVVVHPSVKVNSIQELIALLKAVAYGWRQESITRNAQDISKLGRELYERLGHMAEHFEDMRKALVRTVDSYNDAIGSLEGRVLVSARRFRDLGIAGEELPEAQTVQLGSRRLNAPEMTPWSG